MYIRQVINKVNLNNLHILKVRLLKKINYNNLKKIVFKLNYYKLKKIILFNKMNYLKINKTIGLDKINLKKLLYLDKIICLYDDYGRTDVRFFKVSNKIRLNKIHKIRLLCKIYNFIKK